MDTSHAGTSIKIVNTGEHITDEDLTDEALDQVQLEHSNPTHNPTPNAATPNGDDTPESDDDEEDTDNGSNITDDAIKQAKLKYLREVKRIGAVDGRGRKAKLNFMETVVEGAMDHNSIVQSDAKRFHDSFVKASNEKAMFEDGSVPYDADVDAAKNPKSLDSQLDKVKALIRLGNAFVDEDRKATDIVRRARKLHIDLLADASAKARLKYKSTYEAVVAIARSQFKDEYAGLPLTDEQMHAVWQGKEKPAKTGLDYLYAALDNIKLARKGKEAKDDVPGRDPVLHDNLPMAERNIHSVLAELDPDGFDKWMKKVAKADEKEASVASFRFYTH